MKRVLLVLLAAFMMLVFISCDDSSQKAKIVPKEMAFGGMRITVTSEFRDNSRARVDQGYAFAAYSKSMAIMAVKEDKTEYNNYGIKTLSQYANAVRNYMNVPGSGEIKDEDGFIYYEYVATNPDDGQDYVYLTLFFESNSYFWCVQFTTKNALYEKLKPTMMEYAKTITFVD